MKLDVRAGGVIPINRRGAAIEAVTNMKISKVLHIITVIVGFAGIVTALVGVTAGTGLVWGLTREHILFCSGLLILIAIWLAVSTVHHVMLEDRGKVL